MFYNFSVLDEYESVIMTLDDLDLACGMAITISLYGMRPTVGIYLNDESGRRQVDILRYHHRRWNSDMEERTDADRETKRISEKL